VGREGVGVGEEGEGEYGFCVFSRRPNSCRDGEARRSDGRKGKEGNARPADLKVQWRNRAGKPQEIKEREEVR
jgi:hypothetical protein